MKIVHINKKDIQRLFVNNVKIIDLYTRDSIVYIGLDIKESAFLNTTFQDDIKIKFEGYCRIDKLRENKMYNVLNLSFSLKKFRKLIKGIEDRVEENIIKCILE